MNLITIRIQKTSFPGNKTTMETESNMYCKHCEKGYPVSSRVNQSAICELLTIKVQQHCRYQNANNKKLYFEFNSSTSILFTGSFLNTASPHSRDNPRDVDVIFVCFPVSSGTLISSEDKVIRAWTWMHFERIQRFEWCFKSVRNCMSCILVNATWKTHKNSKCRKSLCHFLLLLSR